MSSRAFGGLRLSGGERNGSRLSCNEKDMESSLGEVVRPVMSGAANRVCRERDLPESETLAHRSGVVSRRNTL
jgi:hypothetical protein